MAFTASETVALRKFCGYGVKTAASLNMQDMFGKLNLILGSLTTEEEAEVRTNYLVKLQTLEDGILLAADNADTDEASVWKHNKNELADRAGIYTNLRRRLCDYLGIDPGTGLESGTRVVRC